MYGFRKAASGIVTAMCHSVTYCEGRVSSGIGWVSSGDVWYRLSSVMRSKGSVR